MSQVLQYELWRECNCKCTFCTLGQDNLHTDNDLKLQSLQTAIDEIKELKAGDKIYYINHEKSMYLAIIGKDFFKDNYQQKNFAINGLS